MALTLLMKVRTGRRTFGVASTKRIPGPSTSTAITGVVSKGRTAAGVTSSKNNSVSVTKTTTSNLAITYECVTVFFIITVACIAGRTRLWLFDVRFWELKPVCIFKSLVNAFIYRVMSGIYRDDVRLFYREMRSWLTCVYLVKHI